jgi:FtsH-binding integral membrane protein
MTEAKPQKAFPRKDEDGRVISFAEFLASALASTVVGLVILVGIDALFSLLHVGSFGSISGWLAGILMVFGFVEDFRAWKGVTGRVVVTALGVVVGVILGSLVNAVASDLPNAFSGAIAVAVAGVIYATMWFFGIRFCATRFGER